MRGAWQRYAMILNSFSRRNIPRRARPHNRQCTLVTNDADPPLSPRMSFAHSAFHRPFPTVCLSMLKCKGQIKSSYSRKPMVVSCQLGQVGWRSTLGTSTFGLLCLFNGHKLPENAIKRPFMAISGSGGSKWLDLSGYWLDLGGIHPGWSVGAIWTHRNCPGGLQGGQKWPKMP